MEFPRPKILSPTLPAIKPKARTIEWRANPIETNPTQSLSRRQPQAFRNYFANREKRT
jgi:hypothetical protein